MWSIRTKSGGEKGKTLSGLIATVRQVERKLVNCMNGRGRKHLVCAAFVVITPVSLVWVISPLPHPPLCL